MRFNKAVAQATFLMFFADCALAQSQAGLPLTISLADDAAIRDIVRDSSAGKPNPHISPTLDWENAFGIRYKDTKKRDAFYAEVVKPLQVNDTGGTLEVKVKLVAPDVAVADEYWHEVGQLDVTTRKPGPDRWGRTTYVLTRMKGEWTEVLERVADLRLGYYHHYDSLPKPAPVPGPMLAQYAGVYAFTDNGSTRSIAVEGDHLTVTSSKKKRLAIPQSISNFLLFDPEDLAEYAKLRFSPDAKTVNILDETDQPVATLTRVK